MFLHFQYFLKSGERTNFSFSAILAQSFSNVLNKNNVIERKHVKECNQLRLRQNLLFHFLCIFMSVRHAYF